MPEKKIISPYAKWYNASEFTPIRAFFKNKSATHHNTIIPQSADHGPLILGAIPTQEMLDQIVNENDNPAIVRVSMLTHEEESSIHYNEPQNSIHISLFDHSAMDAKTGQNITIKEIQARIDEIADLMKEGNVVYFHCMAGHSRSCFGIVSFLYSHPEFLKGLGLGNPPSLREVAGFVKKRRLEVTKIDELKSGQRGLLGLLALNQQTERLKEKLEKEKLLDLNENEAKRIAQDVSFMLHAPLDSSFRNASDRAKQEENFAELYTIYKQAGHNLLLNMLPEGPNILNRFAQLSSNEQAHFAILAQSLISKGVVTRENLEAELGCTVASLTQKAVTNHTKLTAGDQVELLKAFGPITGLTFTDIATRITQGNSIDRHRAGIQLAELLSVAKNNNLLPANKQIIDSFVSRLSVEEQHNFDSRMAELHLDPKDFLEHSQNRVAVQGWQVAQNPLAKRELEKQHPQDQAPTL